MKPAAYLILAVIATATATSTANVASKAAQEPNGLSAAPGRKATVLDQGLDVNEMRADSPVGVEDVGRRNCVTAEMCRRRKPVCRNVCAGPAGDEEVGRKHVPGARCSVKCKKCVPNC